MINWQKEISHDITWRQKFAAIPLDFLLSHPDQISIHHTECFNIKQALEYPAHRASLPFNGANHSRPLKLKIKFNLRTWRGKWKLDEIHAAKPTTTSAHKTYLEYLEYVKTN